MPAGDRSNVVLRIVRVVALAHRPLVQVELLLLESRRLPLHLETVERYARVRRVVDMVLLGAHVEHDG